MVTVPGLPALRIAPHETHAQSRERYAPGTEFHFASISMVGNTGTYVDVPLHRYEGAVEFLVEQGAAVLGIDSQNVDGTEDGERPVHTRLLAAGIPIVEHLTGLAALPPRGFRCHAAPPRIEGVGTFPVRAYAIVTEE